MRTARIIGRVVAAIVAVVVLVAALLIWGPWLRSPNAPAPRASFVRALGESGPGKLAHPIGVAVSDAGDIFVSSSDDHRIVVFHPDGSFAQAFGREGQGPGELERPMHISIGPDGLLYVAEYVNDRISVFRLDGTFVRHFTARSLDAPGGIAVDKSGVIYLANFYGHDILVLSPDGNVARWGRPGRVWHSELHYPTDVGIAPDGSLWVADAYNNRLQRFVEGRSTNIVGWDLGLRIFGFRVATGLGIDPLGRIYGADFGHGKVRVFDGQGTPLESFGSAGSGPGQFDRPEAVAVRGPHLYATDFGNNRLQEWRVEERR